MKLSGYKDDYYYFTGKLGDINRQIAFAGIAIIWIFKKEDGENIILCKDLIFPSILFAIALACDLLQYIYQSLTWAIFYRLKEMKYDNLDSEVTAPTILNYPSWFFFISKVAAVVWAYIKIIIYFIDIAK